MWRFIICERLFYQYDTIGPVGPARVYGKGRFMALSETELKVFV